MVRTAKLKTGKNLSLKSYIRRLSNSVAPEKRMSADALSSLDTALSNKIKGLLQSSIAAADNCKKHTVGSKEGKIAVDAMFSPDYAKKLNAKALAALDKYTATRPAKVDSGKKKKKSPKKKGKASSLGSKAGLILSVARVRNLAKSILPMYTRTKTDKATNKPVQEQAQMRITTPALVYLTGVAEELLSGVLKSSSQVSDELKKKTIMPKAIYGGLVRDKDLFVAFSDYIHSNLGEVREEVKQVLEKALTPKKKGKKTAKGR